jgi:ATP-binding cassette subfamily C protein CydC
MRRTFWRTLKLAAPFGRRMSLSVLLGFATVASGIGLLATSAFLISKAALQPSIAELQVAIVGVRFFGISRGVFRYLERLVSHDATFRVLTRLRVWFYRAIEPLAPARLMQYKSGDLLSRVVADMDSLEHFFVRVIAPPVVAALIALLMWFFMGSFDMRLSVALMFFLGLAAVGLPLLTRWLGRGLGRQMVLVRSELNTSLVDGVQGGADLLAFGWERRHQERIQSQSLELANLQGRMTRIGGLNDALMILLVTGATVVTLVIAIPLVSEGKLDGIYLAVLVLAVVACFEALLPLPQAYQYLEKNLAAARRLFEIVDAQPVVRDPSFPDNGTAPPAHGDYTLQVEELSFRYAPNEPLALDGVSFALPAAGSLAIVGPSGAGKSTLVNLLLRFWDYEAGSVLLGGKELREYPQEHVRRMASVVSQRSHLFNATVRDNLLLARPHAGDADLVRAAQMAQIDAFIQTLPSGYDTWIGEQGLRLSGGQRRRLVIARALLKDAPILILDEATADLDALTERDVMRSVHGLMEHKTTLIITHRLVGLEKVDQILVMHAGRVVERGNHYDLLQANGLYRRMRESQNQIILDTPAQKPVLTLGGR